MSLRRIAQYTTARERVALCSILNVCADVAAFPVADEQTLPFFERVYALSCVVHFAVEYDERMTDEMREIVKSLRAVLADAREVYAVESDVERVTSHFAAIVKRTTDAELSARDAATLYAALVTLRESSSEYSARLSHFTTLAHVRALLVFYRARVADTTNIDRFMLMTAYAAFLEESRANAFAAR